MSKKLKPKEFIERLRDIYGEYPEMSGGCLKFHLLLKEMYPNAAAYSNIDHFVTVIDAKVYDQTGRLDMDYLIENNFRFINDNEMKSIAEKYRDIDSKFIKKIYE